MADASRSGSENDSLLDLYGHAISAPESIERRDPTSQQPTLPQADPLFTLEDEDPERSRWIHRDKLALIESHELQEAGIKLPRHSSLHGRSGSRSRSRKSHSRGASRDLPVAGNQEQEHELLPRREGKRPRTRSPQKQHQDLERPLADIPDYDLRMPEEIASDSSPVYRQQGLRSSSSRIPLPTSTAVPIPQEHRERHTPLPRSRGASGSWPAGDEDGVGYNKLRRRSQSVGSAVLLDGDEPLKSNGASNGVDHVLNIESPISISKQHTVETKATPSNHARKASATLRNVTEPQKARVASTTPRSSPASLPRSRSGLEPRPATAVNRLEGDAPWIADMYKPDPRLPPDQQLVPTHAKRLQQKQIEEEAKSNASTPPQISDFNPVAVHTQNGLRPPSPSVARSPRDLNEKSPAENQAGWPLNVSPKPSMTNANGNANSNGGGNSPGGASDHAGYSTIPKVRSTPTIGSAPSPKLDQQPMRREIEKQVKEKEPSCACCIVM
ncbi:MAG: hypothetical protein Q9195_007710 [Heterodermia aff. obscurata]